MTWWLLALPLWFAVSVVLALVMGRVLRHCSEQRERHDSLDEDIQPCQEASCR